jgi:hypothetical protein
MITVQLMELLKTLNQLVHQKTKFILRKLLFLFHQLKQVSVLDKPHNVVAIGFPMLIQTTQIEVQNLGNFQLRRPLESEIDQQINFSQKMLQSRREKLTSQTLQSHKIFLYKIKTKKNLTKSTPSELMQHFVPPIDDPQTDTLRVLPKQSLLDHFNFKINKNYNICFSGYTLTISKMNSDSKSTWD